MPDPQKFKAAEYSRLVAAELRKATSRDPAGLEFMRHVADHLEAREEVIERLEAEVQSLRRRPPEREIPSVADRVSRAQVLANLLGIAAELAAGPLGDFPADQLPGGNLSAEVIYHWRSWSGPPTELPPDPAQ